MRGLGVTAENAHEHLGVAKVAGDVDAGDSHEANDARILDPFGEEGRHFFADRFRNAVRAAGIVRHRLEQSFARPTVAAFTYRGVDQAQYSTV